LIGSKGVATMYRRYAKFVLPAAAFALASFAIYQVVAAQQTKPSPPPPVEPARNPFGRSVAGAGLVESRSENIAVGSEMSGVVAEVHVRVGQRIRHGHPLFTLVDRQLQTERRVRQAAVATAEAQLAKLNALPRKEELPVYSARVAEAQANLDNHFDQFQRAKLLVTTRAINEEEMVRREQAYRMAKHQYDRAKAEFDLLDSGAWQPDVAIAQRALEQAKAQLAQVDVDLERLTVRAIVPDNEEREVLQVNVRPNEYVNAASERAFIVLGDTRHLHVRVDIDEHDIPRFREGMPARATVRGHTQDSIPLDFVRVEPFVVPKKSLTGDNTERVDTRVLQVIYRVSSPRRGLYVGQQMDVFIDVGTP